jgi:hypothetical protein
MAQSRSRKVPQARTLDAHPPEWRRDLNPNAMAGQNVGVDEPQPARDPGNAAYDRKDISALLGDRFDADELQRIRVLPPGTPLQQNASYIDLKNLDAGELRGRAGLIAQPDQWLVEKRETPRGIWNRLRGIEDPQRTGTSG